MLALRTSDSKGHAHDLAKRERFDEEIMRSLTIGAEANWIPFLLIAL
jgi:hypothetical protein